jgi:oxygen-dependent protoporphyrinogen oxidase
VATASKILVIGGGISGLTCAWRLSQQGCPVLLLEKGRRFGGIIDTIEQDGFRFDIGPQSFTNTPALSGLIDELGLGSELLQADPRAPRYILKSGRLVPAPLSPPQLFLTPLLSARTKFHILSEPFRHTRPPQTDESVASFIRRKFGADLLANLVAPFISGIWAGDPEKLSLAGAFPSVRRFEETYGSVIRGQMKQRRKSRGKRPSLCNFRGGISRLISALAAQLGDRAIAGAEITAICRSIDAPTPGFNVSYKLGQRAHSVSVTAVVVALSAEDAGRLLNDLEPEFAKLLRQIEYAGVAQVSAGYGLEEIEYHNAENGLRGFGFLVPRGEGLRLLGTVWNSSLFMERAPRGMASFTSFLGGMTDPEMVSYSPEQVAAMAHSELATVLGITGPPVAQHVSRWERALPQYNIGHQRRIAGLQNLCARTPGIFLVGNYLAGPSIGGCVEHANQVAGQVARLCSRASPVPTSPAH